MKKSFLLLLCLAGILESYAQNEFTVRARINNPNHYTVFLAYLKNGKFAADTNYIMENGWYVFKGSVSEPVVASFGLRGNPALSIPTDRGGSIPGPALSFILSNDVITIKGDANTVYRSTVKGGKANREWNKIRKQENFYTAKTWNLLREEYEHKLSDADSVEKKERVAARQEVAKKSIELRRNFIKNNPHSIVSMYFLSNEVNDLSLDELKAVYDKLDNKLKSSVFATRIAQKIEGMEATAVGKEAVPISKKDMNGNQVTLQTLKGKYVLIDFWGSWCVPCRLSHPHLKELYSKYKEKGLEILGVAQENGISQEANRKAWLDAIEKDGIDWIQVLNNEGIEQFDAVKSYGVTAFPTKVLLDKDGKVLARYIGFGGNDLDKMLQKIFND
jgi:thiol-disulfide isomerase/thioredoxin